MSGDTLPYIEAKTAAEICQRFALGDDAKALLRDDMTPRQFLALLAQKQQFPDAARFVASALPKREAVWWACQCARAVLDPEAPQAQGAAIEAAEAWAAQPSEERRRAASARSEEAGLHTPGGCAAAAAFWSGGSLAPPDVPTVPPADHLTAHGVAGSVMLAAVESEPERAPEKYRKFFEDGIAVAEGRSRWREPVAESEVKPKEPAGGSSAAQAGKPPVVNWD